MIRSLFSLVLTALACAAMFLISAAIAAIAAPPANWRYLMPEPRSIFDTRRMGLA